MNRLDQQQIEDQLNQERLKFYTGPYTGLVPIPKNLMDVFKDALYYGAPPIKHQMLIASMKGIVNKKIHELNFMEVGSMTNVINNTGWSKIYPDVLTAIESHEKIEEFTRNYNVIVGEFNKKLEKKRQTLMQIIQPMKNASKIIASA